MFAKHAWTAGFSCLRLGGQHTPPPQRLLSLSSSSLNSFQRLHSTPRYFHTHLHARIAGSVTNKPHAWRHVSAGRVAAATLVGCVSALGFFGYAFVSGERRRVLCEEPDETALGSRAADVDEKDAFDRDPYPQPPTLGEQIWKLHPDIISIGGVLGVCSGYFIKKTTKLVAFSIGAIFVLVQILVAKGWIVVRWHNVSDSIAKTIDVDQDGRLSKSDVISVFVHLFDFLIVNFPFNVGFSAGFYLGFYYG